MNKKRVWMYWPEILLVLLCSLLLFADIGRKKGYHMDELLCFELSNAQFNPWIVPTQPQGRLAKFVENEISDESTLQSLANVADVVLDVWKHRGSSKLLSYRADVYEEPVWISGDQFLRFLTVDSDDAFQYLSVYFNVKSDNHPPLYFMLLHTVSSIVRETVNPYMGGIINLFCVQGMLVLLMWLGRKVMRLSGKPEKGRAAGLLSAGFYGFSKAAMCTTLLIRMYALVSFFCVALLAITLHKFYAEKNGGTNFERGNKLLILVTVLGFWTQYFFLFYCLVLAAVVGYLLWRRGRKREVFVYFRSMMLAAVIGVAGFPFAIADVFSSERGVEALGNLSNGFAGYGIRIGAFFGILTERLGRGSVFVLFLAMLIGWVWYKRNGKIGKKAEKSPQHSRWELPALLVLPVIGYFLAAARMSPHLVDRYIMPLFPLAAACIVFGACLYLGKTWIYGLLFATAFVAVFQPSRYEDAYLYSEYPEQYAISEEYRDLPCICIGEGVVYYENLLEFANYEKTLILKPTEFWNRKEQASIRELSEVVVLLKEDVDAEKITEQFERVYGLRLTEVLFERGGVYEDRILLFAK